MIEMEREIKKFIAEELGGWDSPVEEFGSDVAILDEGIIDSLGIYEVVTFVEGAYGVQIDDLDLVTENFSSVASIARLVASKR
jgi:acyl carrier protein